MYLGAVRVEVTPLVKLDKNENVIGRYYQVCHKNSLSKVLYKTVAFAKGSEILTEDNVIDFVMDTNCKLLDVIVELGGLYLNDYWIPISSIKPLQPPGKEK